MTYEMTQSEISKGINYQPITLSNILATTGGQASGIIGIISVLIGSYQAFAYNKSTIKLFYTDDEEVNLIINEKSDDGLTEIRRDVNYKMRKQIARESSNFSMGFCLYQCIWVLSNMCCCLTKYCGCENEGSWYSTQRLKKKRLELAIQKVQKELSVLDYLQTMRTTKLAFKTWLSRR